jgi:hypothetical protein
MANSNHRAADPDGDPAAAAARAMVVVAQALSASAVAVRALDDRVRILAGICCGGFIVLAALAVVAIVW